MQRAKTPMQGIAPLLGAALAYSESETVSALHTEVSILCLKSKCYQHALKLIEKPVTQSVKDCKAIEILSYNMYRGILFCGLNMFEKAAECLR